MPAVWQGGVQINYLYQVEHPPFSVSPYLHCLSSIVLFCLCSFTFESCLFCIMWNSTRALAFSLHVQTIRVLI